MKVKDVSIRVALPVATFAGGLLAGYFAGKYVSWCRYEEILAKDLTDMENTTKVNIRKRILGRMDICKVKKRR